MPAQIRTELSSAHHSDPVRDCTRGRDRVWTHPANFVTKARVTVRGGRFQAQGLTTDTALAPWNWGRMADIVTPGTSSGCPGPHPFTSRHSSFTSGRRCRSRHRCTSFRQFGGQGNSFSCSISTLPGQSRVLTCSRIVSTLPTPRCPTPPKRRRSDRGGIRQPPEA